MSESRIYLVGEDNTLSPLQETAFLKETHLQKLLASQPTLLGGDDISEEGSRRWMLIGREIPVPVHESSNECMSLDLLYVDQDGVPTLMEVKRSSDTRIRREVVGQLLDYAAGAVIFWTAQDLRERFEARCVNEGLDPVEQIENDLAIEVDIDEFWESVGANLASRKLCLFIAADRLRPELRRIIEFMNATMPDLDVLGLELRQFRSGKSRALVPQIVGLTAATQALKASRRTKTNQVEFLASWQGDVIQQRFEAILAFAHEEQLVVNWGTAAFPFACRPCLGSSPSCEDTHPEHSSIFTWYSPIYSPSVRTHRTSTAVSASALWRCHRQSRQAEVCESTREPSMMTRWPRSWGCSETRPIRCVPRYARAGESILSCSSCPSVLPLDHRLTQIQRIGRQPGGHVAQRQHAGRQLDADDIGHERPPCLDPLP